MPHDKTMTDRQMAEILADPVKFADALGDEDFVADWHQRLWNSASDEIKAEERMKRLRYRTSPICMLAGHRYNPVTETTEDELRGQVSTREGRECSVCGRYELIRWTGSMPRTRGAWANASA